MKLALTLITLSLSLLFSCKEKSNAIEEAFITGQVINPTNTFITLGKPEKEKDTFYLDENSFFKTSLKIDEEGGLYEFKHGIERQLFYIERGDSLTLRVNTIAFDESLAFGGKGAEKNSFLLDLYLDDEKQAARILSQVKTEPKAFVKQLKKKKESLNAKLEALDSKLSLSQPYFQLASKLITIQEFVLKERYAYLVYKLNPQNSQDLDSTFFEHRNALTFNDVDLEHTFLYHHFFENYTLNKVMESKFNQNGRYPKDLDLYSYPFLKERIELVENSTPLISLRNKFFERYGKHGIILSNDTVVARQTIDLLAKMNFPKDYLQNLKNYQAIQSLFLPGQSVGGVRIIDSNDTIKSLTQVITKPSVVHSWSLDSYRHHFNSHKKIKQLQNQYPDIDFIGVNTDYVDIQNDPQRLEKWKKTIKTFNYNADKEFQMLSSKLLSDLLKAYKNKVLFVNKNSEIIIGATTLNSDDFDQQFERFQDMIAQGI